MLATRCFPCLIARTCPVLVRRVFRGIVRALMNMTRLILTTATAILLNHPLTSLATMLNLGFESGDFQNWRLNIPRGNSEMSSRSQPAGTAQTVSSWIQQPGLSQLRAAVEGNTFAALGTLADGRFTGNRTYNITLSRTIHLRAGETISGSAFFYNGDTIAQDSAWVKILDEEGCAIAQPWFEVSGRSPTSTNYHAPSPWTSWSWQAPTESTFSLILGMTTGGDNNMPSYGFFDDICVKAATSSISPVPEPSSLSLLALGAAGLAALRRKIKQL